MDDLARFEASLTEATPPPGLSRPLLALWHQGRGEWEAAHTIVQENEADPTHAWVHAHLHRMEGDLGNAAYWYRRARQPTATGELREEWRAIVQALLGA
jgi:hypothetical protein